MIEAIAVLICEGKKRGMSVYHSGSGEGVWQHENGQARLEAVVRRLTSGRFNLVTYDTRYVGLIRAPQDFDAGTPMDWGRLDNATIVRLNSEPNAAYLREDSSAAVHRSNRPASRLASASPAPWKSLPARPAAAS
jgi:hypothetical protein